MDKFKLNDKVQSVIYCKYRGAVGVVTEVIYKDTNVEAYKVKYENGSIETYDGKDLIEAE